jgi:hypothetical protein
MRFNGICISKSHQLLHISESETRTKLIKIWTPHRLVFMQMSGNHSSSCETRRGDKREWERKWQRVQQFRIIWCVKQGAAFEGALKCQILCPPARKDACGWQRVMCAGCWYIGFEKEKHTHTLAFVCGTRTTSLSNNFNQLPELKI